MFEVVENKFAVRRRRHIIEHNEKNEKVFIMNKMIQTQVLRTLLKITFC